MRRRTAIRPFIVLAVALAIPAAATADPVVPDGPIKVIAANVDGDPPKCEGSACMECGGPPVRTDGAATSRPLGTREDAVAT